MYTKREHVYLPKRQAFLNAACESCIHLQPEPRSRVCDVQLHCVCQHTSKVFWSLATSSFEGDLLQRETAVARLTGSQEFDQSSVGKQECCSRNLEGSLTTEVRLLRRIHERRQQTRWDGRRLR